MLALPCCRRPLGHQNPSLHQQSAAELAKESLSPEDYAGVNTALTWETLGLKEKPPNDVTPATLMETNSLGLTQPNDIRVRQKGWRKASLETPMETTSASTDLWTILPFAQTSWRSTYRVRIVTSTDNVDPKVQEVLDLSVRSLAAAKDEDPDLQLMKELL